MRSIGSLSSECKKVVESIPLSGKGRPLVVPGKKRRLHASDKKRLHLSNKKRLHPSYKYFVPIFPPSLRLDQNVPVTVVTHLSSDIANKSFLAEEDMNIQYLSLKLFRPRQALPPNFYRT